MMDKTIISNVKRLGGLSVVLEYRDMENKENWKYGEYRFYIRQNNPHKSTKLIICDDVRDAKTELDETNHIRSNLFNVFKDHLDKHYIEELIETDDKTKVFKEIHINKLYESLLENIVYANDNEENKTLSLEELEKEDRELFEICVKYNIQMLVRDFNERRNVNKNIVEISDFIQLYYRIKRQYMTKTTFQQDIAVKGYNRIHEDDIREILRCNDLKVNDKDVKTIISHIDTDLFPVYDKVKFNNLIYDMLTHKEYNPETAILAHRQVDLDYKQHEYPTINSYLQTSLNQATEEETEKYIQGIKELVGYLFTSGNIENKILVLAGSRGGGKSTFTRLLNNIFGTENISNTSFQRLISNQFGTAAIRDKVLNVTNDTDKKPIYDIGLLKQISGYDQVEIEQKGKDMETAEREELPKLMLAGNHIPEFKNIDDALLERLIIIRFRHNFRGTDKENKGFSKGFPKHEIEGFVYDCLEMYKLHTITQEDFILDKNIDSTLKMVEMYSKPYDYLVSELLIYDEKLDTNDGVATEEVYQAIVKLAKNESIELLGKTKNAHKRRILQAIRRVNGLDGENDQYNTRLGSIEGYDERVKYYPQMKKNHNVWDLIEDQTL